MALVAQSWPSNEYLGYGCSLEDMSTCCCFGGVDNVTIESACVDDYRPVPPSDGSWCGVRLDDRYPLRDDSFPTIEAERP
jgi:hypothetical protein